LKEEEKILIALACRKFLVRKGYLDLQSGFAVYDKITREMFDKKLQSRETDIEQVIFSINMPREKLKSRLIRLKKDVLEINKKDFLKKCVFSKKSLYVCGAKVFYNNR